MARSWRRRTDLATVDGPGDILGGAEFDDISDLAAGDGRRVQGDPARSTTQRPSPRRWPSHRRRPAGLRVAHHARGRTGRRSCSAARAAATPDVGRGRDRRWTVAGRRDRRPAARRGRDRDKASPSSTPRAPHDGDGRLDGGAHGMASSTGIEDKLFVTTGSAEGPDYHVLKVSGSAAANGPVDRGRTRCPAWSLEGRSSTRPPSWSTSWAAAGRRRRERALDGLRHRAARELERCTPTSCQPTSTRSPGRWTSSPSIRPDDRQDLLGLRRRRDRRVDRHRLARLRVAAAGRDRRVADGRLPLRPRPRSSSAAAASPSPWPRSRSSTGCSSSNRASA